LGRVPHVSNDYVCDYCLGPVTSYSQCWGCSQLFHAPGVPLALQHVTVPMTSVLNPGPWYRTLVTYKNFERKGAAVLASLAYTFTAIHAAKIAAMLGGPPTLITIVPSKRGIQYDDQPLRAALSLVAPLQAQLRQTLTHLPDQPYGRRKYSPEVFGAGPEPVDGARVILIEDTWVTGATAMSAAGALLNLGAESVAVLPIARVVAANFWPADHPYRVAMEATSRPVDPATWPR
jgi:hypothetical protein